jgi:hypothetical protein
MVIKLLLFFHSPLTGYSKMASAGVGLDGKFDQTHKIKANSKLFLVCLNCSFVQLTLQNNISI